MPLTFLHKGRGCEGMLDGGVGYPMKKPAD